MRLPLLLAWRFLKSSHEKSISAMLRICFISIVIGTGSLTLIAAIMNGFEQATHKKLQGIHADITISAGGKNINYAKLSELLKKDYGKTIKASSPTSMYHVMLETQVKAEPYDLEKSVESTICLLKAIDPETEPLVTTLGSMFTNPNTWELLDGTGICIGQSLAERLNLTVGSEATLIYHTQDEEETLSKKKVKIVGLFKTGIHDYDEQILIASYEMVDSMYPHKVTQVSSKLYNQSEAPEVIKSLKKVLPLKIRSWKDLYLPLVAALTLEKYAMWLILSLVTLVASLTIVSLLYMYATHKRTDIALLTSTGMPSRDLKKVFLFIAGILTFSATACGILLAALGTWLLQTFPFITLPDVYYVSHLPAELTGSIIISVVLVALIISIVAGLFPHARSNSMSISELLKGML